MVEAVVRGIGGNFRLSEGDKPSKLLLARRQPGEKLLPVHHAHTRTRAQSHKREGRRGRTRREKGEGRDEDEQRADTGQSGGDVAVEVWRFGGLRWCWISGPGLCRFGPQSVCFFLFLFLFFWIFGITFFILSF